MTVRDYVVTAAFGAFGGTMEISLGSMVHTFPILPFKGLLPAMIITLVIVAAWVYCDGNPRIPFYVGVVIAFLKLLSIAGALLLPMIAILFETMVIGLILMLSNPARWTGPVLSGVAVAFTTVLHRLLSQVFLYGMDIIDVYIGLVDNITRMVGRSGYFAWWLLVPVALIHIAAGLLFGYQGWALGRYFRKVLQH